MNPKTELATTGDITPASVMSLMELAIKEQGQDAVGKLERLVALAERVADRRAAAEFSAAYANFREAMPTVIRARKHAGASRDGGGLSWWYAPIEQIVEVAEPHLRANGLYVSWGEDATDQNATTVTCTLHHVSGHSRSARATIGKGSKNRAVTQGQIDAGALTSAQRRALAMVLGIVTSDPEDSPPAETITPEQSDDLERLLSQLAKPDAAKQRMLAWAKAGTVSEILADQYQAAKGSLLKLIERERSA